MGAAQSEEISDSQQGPEPRSGEPQARPKPPGQYTTLADAHEGVTRGSSPRTSTEPQAEPSPPGQNGSAYGGAATRRPFTSPNFQGDPGTTGNGANRGGGGAAGRGDNENGSSTRKEAVKRQLAAAQAKGAEMVGGGRERVTSATDYAKKKTTDMVDGGRERINSATYYAKKKTMEVASDKTTQVVAASGLGGAVVVGAGGAGVGLLTGGAAGAAIGLLPALFTFGLSIPVGAVIGATCGTVVGAATGGTVGVTGGSAIGYVAYKKRADIRTFLVNANIKIRDSITRTKTKITYYADMAKTKVVDSVTKTHSAIHTKATAVLGSTKEKLTRAAQEAKAETKKLVADKEVRRAAASGVAGATALGAGGAAAGMATGGAIGAAVGLVPALFTFGLSIPFCAVVGGGCGLAAGATVGSTTGGAAGVCVYTAYQRREAIRRAIRSAVEKASGKAGSVAEQTGLSEVAQDSSNNDGSASPI